MTTARHYHHGHLRQAVLSAAVEVIAESGPTSLSLRALAGRVGVSHAAPAHHFGDKAGVLTAIAIEGYQTLADQLSTARHETGDFREVGVAYVRFALRYRAHFAVMYRPDLYHADATDLVAARQQAAEQLYSGVRGVVGLPSEQDARLPGIAAWSLMHGFATLWMDSALPTELGTDPDSAARAIAGMLFRPAEQLSSWTDP